MFQQSLGLTNLDSLPDTEDNPTFIRFQEVLDRLMEMIPQDSSNLYLKMGMRISKEIAGDMRRMPEETIQWYCRQFGAAMLYIATGRDPDELLSTLSIPIETQ